MTTAAGPTPANGPDLMDQIQIGKTYQEIPVDQVEILARLFSDVPVRVQRRSARGTLVSTPGGWLTMPAVELAEFDRFADKTWGGGNFFVQVKDPTQPTRVLFSFSVAVEGQPKIPASASPTAAFSPAPATVPLPGGSAPQAARYAAPATAYASDELAVQQAAHFHAEAERVKAEAKADREKFEAKIAALENESRRGREEAAEARHRGELAALSAKIDAMTSQPKTQSPLEMLAGVAAAAAPFVPVFQAMVGSRSSAEERAMQMQSNAMQAALAAASARPPDSTKELLTTFGPMFMPAITAAMNRNPSEDQAKLFSALVDSQLNTLQMATSLAEATAPPPETAVGAVVKSAMESLKTVAMAYAAGRGGPGQLPADATPTGVLRGQVHYETVEDPPAAPGVSNAAAGQVVDEPRRTNGAAAKTNGRPAPVAPEVEALFGMLPADFQSAEWKVILRGLHTTPPMEPERVSGLLASHLEHLLAFGLLPSLLAGVTEKPRETLESILEKLPVASTNPAYAAKVLDTTLEMLMQDGFTPAPAQEEESEEEVS